VKNIYQQPQIAEQLPDGSVKVHCAYHQFFNNVIQVHLPTFIQLLSRLHKMQKMFTKFEVL